ncbi:MAG TPA: pitrilysin family protein, partial [Desulfobacteraceae bacterium]|nr:pitrilysin family protein [Desulfobacteraceae bacterium]
MKRPLSFTLVSLMMTCLVLVMFAGCRGGEPRTVLNTTTLEKTSGAGETAGTLADKGESPETLAFDPALVRGTLDNGFRYVLLENKTPENRVSMHLDVLAGSMNETEQQRGIAHFLEHMLFNGSTHFPPGELVEYFQSIGMRFGADANASTSFFATVYDIFLPAGDRENIDQGLLVLEDYARGALLLQSEIDRERGIVLSEKRNRDSVAYRTFQKSLRFELPGSRITRRFPIGLEQVIKEADAEMFRRFYDTWYRPDNMVLVMAGDFDASQAEAMIKKRFAAMAPRGEKKRIPDVSWEPHSGLKAFYHHEAEAGNTEVSINTLERVPFKGDDLDSFRQRTVENIATKMFNNRLAQLVREPGAPFTDAGCFSGRYLHSVDYASLSAETRPENWKKTLGALENRLRQALEYGFTGQELERAKADFLLELDRAVKEADTRKSSALARQIIHRINRKRVFQSPRQRRALLTPVVEALSLETVNDAFADIWSADHRLVEVTGNASIASDPAGAEEKILSLFNQSRTQGVEPYRSREGLSFPYLPEPEKAGEIRNVRKIDDLGIQQVSFENRVRLNLKKTDFKQGVFLFRVDFGSGRKAQPRSMPGLGLIAESVINGSGLGAMDRDQLDEALAGRNLEMTFATNSDGFSLAGRANNGEAELVFQLMR